MEDLININDDVATSEKDNVEVFYGKVLDIKSSTPDIDFKGIINKVCQYTNIFDVLDKVKKGTKFVVQIPTELQGGFDTGDYWMMENAKTGTLWPSLMELGDDGRNRIVTPLSIKKQEYIQGNPAKDIANNYHNIYMQQQMNELISMVETTYKAVERIEHGQMDDRIALLEAGKQGVILALSQKDDASRSQAMLLAINNLNIAQNQIAETLKRRVNEFEVLPKTKLGRFIREYVHTGYLDEKDTEYDKITEYYGLYIEATKMLAGSYAIIGDLDNAQKVFELGISKMENIDFSRLKSIEYEHKEDEIEKIYENSTEYLITEQELCLEESKEYDCLSITVSKEEFWRCLKMAEKKRFQGEKLNKKDNEPMKKAAKGAKKATAVFGVALAIAPVIKKHGKDILKVGKDIIFRA